jgi:hypothetical protein
MTELTWRERTFDGPPVRRTATNRALLALSWLVLAATAAVMFVSRDRAILRCQDDCYGGAPLDRFGSVSYEPGHPWTSYADSWQWSVQHGLTQLAVVAGIVAVGLALMKRNPLPAVGAAAACVAGWLVWLSLSPPLP